MSNDHKLPKAKKINGLKIGLASAKYKEKMAKSTDLPEWATFPAKGEWAVNPVLVPSASA